MSIIYTLKKLVDPIAARAEDARLKKAREQVRQQHSGDPPEPGPAPDEAPPRFRCRCCGVEDAQGAYCPECLADTMEPVEDKGEGEGKDEGEAATRPADQS